ncbi:MAG: cytochrome [Bacteroidetes bacterium]|jgi:hypothetical protein|nr:cytochrome [Bacteroidota bacterium]
MSKKKKILLVIAGILILIQFIRPADNEFPENPTEALAAAIPVPPDVNNLLKTACNDCHSNHTDKMWYQNIQPIGWWLNHHIEEGKDELNFSVFNTYSVKRQAHKMEEITEMVENGEMPMDSYTWMHGDAKLNEEQKKMLISWAKAAQDSLEKQIPAKK